MSNFSLAEIARTNVYEMGSNYFNGAVQEILAINGSVPANPTINLLGSGFQYPLGLAVDGRGDVFHADNDSSSVGEIQRSRPPTLTFGSTPVGTTSSDSPRTVQIQNTGNAPLFFSTLDGQNNPSYEGDFHKNTTDANLCTSGLELAPGASCDVSIDFLPSAEGVIRGRVVLTDNALNGNPAKQTILLSGTGAGSPAAEVSPNPLEFGAIAFGSSKTLPLTITNTGGSALTIAPSGNGPSFTIQSSTCTAGVAAGASCVLQVRYAPATFGVHGDFLTLTTNGSSNPVVKLSGETVGVGVTTSVLNFGTIPFGTTETLPLTVTSYGVTGTVPITLSIDGSSYTVVGNTCSGGVGPGQNCTLEVKFSPTTVGQHEHHLVVTSSYGTIPVLLEGAASQP